MPGRPMRRRSSASCAGATAAPARSGCWPIARAPIPPRRPKQAPELSPMDQLWRELKRLIAANRQAESIDALAEHAAEWLLTLAPQQARRKAGMTSKRFWLKSLLQDLWLPT